MLESRDLIESFNILDGIKFKLNEVLIKGVESLSNENLSELIELKQKFETINFSTLSQLLNSFLLKIEQLSHPPVSNDLKRELSKDILKMITYARMFEKVMTLESVKKIIKRED